MEARDGFPHIDATPGGHPGGEVVDLEIVRRMGDSYKDGIVALSEDSHILNLEQQLHETFRSASFKLSIITSTLKLQLLDQDIT